VLDQSGDAVLERHYQSQFISHDLQHVVLLRPSQEGLLRAAGSMLRKRDPLAPSNLTDAQKRTIRQNPEVLELRREKRELMEEMRSLAGTIGKAREPFPHLYQRHKEVKKELSQLRKTLVNNTRQTARKDYFHTAPVLEVDRQIKQLLGQSNVDHSDADSSEDEDCELPILEYVFPERGRLVENFYGPEAENFDEDKLLARRIQVTKDMVALSQLCEPSRRGNQINWDIDDYNEPEKLEEVLPVKEEFLKCPMDICIICCGQSQLSASNPPPHRFPPKRKDSLRRHLIDSHLAHAHDGISCTWPACHGIPKFSKATEYLAHAVTVHAYDIHIKLHHFPRNPGLTCSDTSSVDSTVESVESDDRSGTDTPASSVGPEMANIDPRLLESQKAIVTEPPLHRSKRLRSQ
jgi:hypothetical protein